MFKFFKRKKSEADIQKILNQFIALTFSDEKLSMPVYLPELKNEFDADNLGIGPLIYVWNVDHEAGKYSVSVNGKAVGYLLELLLSRSDPSFSDVRDQAMQIILELSQGSVSKTIEQTGLMPDVLFRQ